MLPTSTCDYIILMLSNQYKIDSKIEVKTITENKRDKLAFILNETLYGIEHFMVFFQFPFPCSGGVTMVDPG